MRKHISTLALPWLLTIALLPLGASGSEPSASKEEITRVENNILRRAATKDTLSKLTTITQRMRELGIPALSIAVIDDGRVAWTKAYGLADAVEKTQATPETLFQAGSISKPIAALGALRLVKEGRITLDRDVNSELKSWKLPGLDPTTPATVTLRQLLSHTAGVTVHGFAGYATTEPVPTVLQVLDGVPPANSPPVRVDAIPGSLYRYSGGGYTVMQRLIEDVSGESFADFMQAKVLAELGMTSSTYSQSPLARLHRASGHGPADTRIPGKAHIYPEMAAAGLWTTPTDLAKYLLYVERAMHGEGGALLNAQLAKEMLTRQNGGPYGLGPEVYAVGEFARFGHDGSDAGFEATMVAYVEGGKGLVVMANSNGAAMFFDEIKASVARAYLWPGFPIKPQVEVRPISATLRRRCAGKYRMDGGDIAEFTDRGGALFLTPLSEGGRFEVLAKSDTQLVSPQFKWIQFEPVVDGDKVIALKLDNGIQWPRID